MGGGLEISDGLTASAMRMRAAREKKNRVARRMLAIANALEGIERVDAARARGMDRQVLRTAIVDDSAGGLAGLQDGPASGRPPALADAGLALLSARIVRGPAPEIDGVKQPDATGPLRLDRGAL